MLESTFGRSSRFNTFPNQSRAFSIQKKKKLVGWRSNGFGFLKLKLDFYCLPMELYVNPQLEKEGD